MNLLKKHFLDLLLHAENLLRHELWWSKSKLLFQKSCYLFRPFKRKFINFVEKLKKPHLQGLIAGMEEISFPVNIECFSVHFYLKQAQFSFIKPLENLFFIFYGKTNFRYMLRSGRADVWIQILIVTRTNGSKTWLLQFTYCNYFQLNSRHYQNKNFALVFSKVSKLSSTFQDS